MRELIYYPTFEMRNKEWLKFALLYIESLHPIIPVAGDVYLSDDFKRIIHETDLVTKHRPSNEEGYKATLDAVDQVERILRRPKAFTRIFSDPNYLMRWRNPKEQIVVLFQEKYAEYWEYFCKINKIGRRSSHGLMVSRDVAYIYMTILAQCIADSRGISTITDIKQLDIFSIFVRKQNLLKRNNVFAAQREIQLELPKSLEEISFEKIISLRNKQNFKQKQRAFHAELERYLDNHKDDSDKSSFKKCLGNIWEDFSDELAQIGSGTVVFSLGMWQFLNSPGDTVVPALAETFAGAGFAIGSIIPIRKTWKNTETRRLARRYLADIHGIES